MKQRKLISVMCLAVLVFNIAAFAGSLEPSAVPAPTMKTLDQVEPRTAITSLPCTISASGSYYLTGNLTLATGQNGIAINADNVTIDLCGFTIDGNKYVQHGIYATTRKNIVIKNGNIINWYGYGIYLSTSTSCTMANITMNNIGFSAIQVGANSRISDCIVTGCRSTSYYAIYTIGLAIIKNCVVADCNYGGISISDRAAVIECTVKNNKSSGIFATNTSIVKDCISQGNSDYGIYVASGSIVSGCAINGNGNHGIYLDSSTAINNHCNSNGSGYPTTGSGFFVQGTGCRVEGNTANSNAKYGFSITSTNNIIVKNFARGNGSPVTNYSTSGGNIGTIVTAMTATDPWANFSF